MQKWERLFPNPDYMNIPSFSRSVSRGSAVGWFLVLLLVCGAGAGYYLYQDNLAKRKAAQELTAERKLKEKKAREAADVANMRSAKSAVLIEYVDGSMDPDDAGDVYYYSASEGTLKTDASDALPVYGQGNASVDGGIRYDDYNETGSSGKVIGTDAKDKIIKITVTPSDDGLENGIHVEMEWVDE